MARWRPPVPASSPYITPSGFSDLQVELQSLWTRRKEVTQAVSAAAAEGDRSENAEYIYRKKELREIDRRIRYLQKRIPSLNVVTKAPVDQDRIFFGARVTLQNECGDEVSYRIVGPDEFDLAKGFISLDSPLARSLLNKKCDQEVVVESEQEEHRYLILDIHYIPFLD